MKKGLELVKETVVEEMETVKDIKDIKEELELVKELKETVVEEMKAMKDIKEEVTTKELVKAFGIGAIKGFIGATAITALTLATVVVIAKKMK